MRLWIRWMRLPCELFRMSISCIVLVHCAAREVVVTRPRGAPPIDTAFGRSVSP